MASEPVDTCWILPQTPDGVDDGEIVQKEWSISLRSKMKANRASPQTSFGLRHFNSQLFSASLARLQTPPVSTKPTKRTCLVFYLHRLLRFSIIDCVFFLPPLFFYSFSSWHQNHCASPLQKGYHRHHRHHQPLSLFTRRLYRSLHLFPSTETR